VTNAAGLSISETLTVQTAGSLPIISSFLASPASIVLGQNSILTWSVTGATSLSISPNVGSVTGNSVSVSPTSTTTYTLLAMNAAGSSISKITVTVTGSSAAPTISSFTALSPSIISGQSIAVTWSVSGATSLSISPTIGPVTGTSTIVTPREDTTYTLTATNQVGSVTSIVTIAVNPEKPTISDFSFTNNPIRPGNTSSISVSFRGGTALIDNGVGVVTSGESVDIYPQSTMTYTVYVTGLGGTTTASKTITVTQASSYVAGSVDNPIGDPGYWHNGVYKHLDPTVYREGARAIVFSSGDLYVSGRSGYWKNGKWIGLNQTGESEQINIGSFTVSGSDVYAAGSITKSDQLVTHGYWLNGNWIPLAEDLAGGLIVNNGDSLIVSGGDIYIGGKSGYWKNGTWVPLFGNSPTSLSSVSSLVVSGSNVYASGYSTHGIDNARMIPCYWLNGLLVELTNPSLDTPGGFAKTAVAGVPCMALSESDIYVGGNLLVPTSAIGGSTLVPGYWLNGKWVTLPIPSGSSGGLVTSIRISGADVYVGGGLNPVTPTTVGIPGYWLNGSWVPQALPVGSSSGSVISLFIQ